MLRICCAEDGQIFEANASVRDIERTGSLEQFLHSTTGVEAQAILAFLSDGRRLTTTSIRELAGSPDQTIFVFNKYYLDYDLEEVLHELYVHPPLQPSIEENISATPPFRPAQLVASHLRIGNIHQEQVAQLMQSITLQHDGIRIASTSLDMNVLSVADIFRTISETSKKELQRQAVLLAGVDADLDIISRVNIHVDFMSASVRKTIENGEKHRTLGDYVSNQKMKQVAEVCGKTHDELRSRSIELERSVTTLQEGADAVRAAALDMNLAHTAESHSRQAREIFGSISDTAAKLETPHANAEEILKSLKGYDSALRNIVQAATDCKNESTKRSLTILQEISSLNTTLIQLPAALSSLQASFRAKNSFAHIQRLHNMLYAYCATVVEIVRRKEFSRFFYQRAQSILEVMAKLSAGEKKRRQLYRSELHGQLPFETRGLDDVVPTIDFTPSRASDVSYSLERGDVDGILLLLDALEQSAQDDSDVVALEAIRQCRLDVDKLVAKMDSIESGFDKIAERSLLSASRLSLSRRRLSAVDEQAFQQLTDELRASENARSQQDATFQQERAELQTEIRRLRMELDVQQGLVTSEQERAESFERELRQTSAQLESETIARKALQDRHNECAGEAEKYRHSLEEALSHGADHVRATETLRQELAQAHVEFEDLKEMESSNAAKITILLEEQSENLRKLEEARSRGENLEVQIRMARTETDDLSRALRDASKEKDKLLRAQSTEHDRIIRDHIAESDGDRAVMEHQLSELKAVLNGTQERLSDSCAELEVAKSDAIGLREELQRVEHKLRESQHTERELKQDVSSGKLSHFDLEQNVEQSARLIASILDAAIGFRNSHVKALTASYAMASHPSSRHAGSMSDSAFAPARHNAIGEPEEQSPIDPTDPVSALEALRSFDHDHFLEVVNKTGSTIRKWQKQCKEYRERAKGKISFRNFAKGDLALFLPTRNSASKPWAAFNVSFPHYFLQATGHLADQLKTREWIVARITSIRERVVDQQDPESNPYGLGDGVKYYLLEVEDWTQPAQQTRRRSSTKKALGASKGDHPSPENLGASPPESEMLLAPPQAEVEDSFKVTRPPTSHLFPARPRSSSSPNARPSSLSRLLAQAPVDSPAAESPSLPPAFEDASPAISPPPPPSPSQHSGSNAQVASIASPLRPGSRSSRVSTTSRFSAGKLPAFGSPSSGGIIKAAPTTALAEEPQFSSLSESPEDQSRSSTPSPQGSLTEGMSSVLHSRRRTTSQHVSRSSPLSGPGVSVESDEAVSDGNSGRRGSIATNALANLANSWGVAFARKAKPAARGAPGGSEG